MPLRTRSRRSFFASLFAATLAATVLSGCPAPSNNEGATSSTTTTGGGGTATPASGDGIVIAWAEWEPAKQLEVLAKDFTAETKIPVTVQQFPWSDFETKIKTAWSGQSADYDLIIGDSQWLGKAATAGHYVEITDWAKENVSLADITPAALNSYGEYPAGSGKLYALPAMADATVFAYRKDLFEDATNKAAFQKKYGHPLAPPKTWEEFAHVAEFFTQPNKKLYGAALYYARQYDGVTMGFDQVLWSYGGQLSDASGKKIEGVLNSPEGVKALEFYSSLKKFTPPGSETHYFAECLTAFQEGQVAMTQSWFAFCPDLVNKDKNKFADKTGYFVVPKGPAGHFISLGGQGMSVSAYSKKQDQAKQFMKWFESEETQKKWASLGGLTANSKVAKSDTFLKATPYNAVFAESVPHLKDFYNTPEYSELLEPAQNYLNQAVAGAMPAKTALDTLAKEQQKVVDEAGK